MREVNCPVCGNKKREKILTKDTLLEKYTLVRCTKCSLFYINPQPEHDELAQYYNKEYDVPPYQKEKILKKAKKIIPILKKHKVRTILEVGSSYGYFLKELKKKRFIVQGIELSKKACTYARKRFKLRTFCGDINSYKTREKFDAVVMLDLIEHIPDQKRFLKKIKELVKPGGLLIMTTPNINSLEYKLIGRYWEWMSPPAHLVYYSPETIVNTLKRYGFRTEVYSYKGDAAGNLFFEWLLGMRYAVFNSLKYILGRERMKRKKIAIMKSARGLEQIQKKEFVGYMGVIKTITDILGIILWPLSKIIRTRNNYPSLFVVGKRK